MVRIPDSTKLFYGGFILLKLKVYATFLKLFMKNEFTCHFVPATSFSSYNQSVIKGPKNTQKMFIKIDFSVQFYCQ